jgi:8-oxo-dGTP diphosphatase
MLAQTKSALKGGNMSLRKTIATSKNSGPGMLLQLSLCINLVLFLCILLWSNEKEDVVPSHLVTPDCQTELVFHGGHPVTSALSGSCYCSGIDTYCMCNPSLAIDLVILSGPDHLWLVRRKDTQQLAIVGGFVDIGETVLAAVHRELREETGLHLPTPPVLFGVYSDPRRDNRRHTVSVAFAVHLDTAATERPVAADDVQSVERVKITDLETMDLFSDQKTIVQDYLRILQKKKEGTQVGPMDFTTSVGDFAPDIQRSVCIPFSIEPAH